MTAHSTRRLSRVQLGGYLVSDKAAVGTSVLLVEQNARAALKIAHRGYVVENGAITLQGTAAELARDSRVVEAYLGA